MGGCERFRVHTNIYPFIQQPNYTRNTLNSGDTLKKAFKPPSTNPITQISYIHNVQITTRVPVKTIKLTATAFKDRDTPFELPPALALVRVLEEGSPVLLEEVVAADDTLVLVREFAAVDVGTEVAVEDGAALLLSVFPVVSPFVVLDCPDSTAPAAVASSPKPEYVCR